MKSTENSTVGVLRISVFRDDPPVENYAAPVTTLEPRCQEPVEEEGPRAASFTSLKMPVAPVRDVSALPDGGDPRQRPRGRAGLAPLDESLDSVP